MLKVTGIKLHINHTDEDLLKKIADELKVRLKDIKEYKIIRKSIDARKGQVKYIYSVNVLVKNEIDIIGKKYIINNKNIMSTNEKKYIFPKPGNKKMNYSPIIVGSGPAGLFCAYELALMGYKPILIERGEDVDKRESSVNNFWNLGVLNTESNVQFGEGGAGTFSDGKLNTLVNDKEGRNQFVLETFHKFGAPEEITYDSKPHIGTDILKDVVKNMRNAIIEAGGQVKFGTKLTNIFYTNNSINEIEINHSDRISCETLVLAPGHSARDTFKMLKDNMIYMEPKSFAVGIRIEHPQKMINMNQYGVEYYDKLPAAPYKLAGKSSTGRNVYSFCMCPGGYVVNASSEEKMTAVNGMSYSKRDSGNANSALIVNVAPEDFAGNGPLSGLEFQRNLEKAAYNLGNGKVPIQLYEDFKLRRPSGSLGDVIPCIKGNYELSDISTVFPEYIYKSLVDGIEFFSGKIKNYNRKDAVLAGVESRTSSPLRINRDESFQCNISGIYPCGEGAGYAGGITSAAMDGMKVAEAIITDYMPFDDFV